MTTESLALVNDHQHEKEEEAEEKKEEEEEEVQRNQRVKQELGEQGKQEDEDEDKEISSTEVESPVRSPAGEGATLPEQVKRPLVRHQPEKKSKEKGEEGEDQKSKSNNDNNNNNNKSEKKKTTKRKIICDKNADDDDDDNNDNDGGQAKSESKEARSRRQVLIDSRSILNNKQRLKRFWEHRMEMEFKWRQEQEQQQQLLTNDNHSMKAAPTRSAAANRASGGKAMLSFSVVSPAERGINGISNNDDKHLGGGRDDFFKRRPEDGESQQDENNNNNNNNSSSSNRDNADNGQVSAELLCEKLLAYEQLQRTARKTGGETVQSCGKSQQRKGEKDVDEDALQSPSPSDVPNVDEDDDDDDDDEHRDANQPMSINPILCNLKAREPMEDEDFEEEQVVNEEFGSSNSSLGPASQESSRARADEHDAAAHTKSGSSDDEEETSTQSGSVLTVISNSNNSPACDKQQRQVVSSGSGSQTGGRATPTMITSIEEEEAAADHDDLLNDLDRRPGSASCAEREQGEESDASNIGVAFESLQFDDEIKSSKSEQVDEERLLAAPTAGAGASGKSRKKPLTAAAAATAGSVQQLVALAASRSSSNNNNNNSNNNDEGNQQQQPQPQQQLLGKRASDKFTSREVKSVCALITSAISDAAGQLESFAKAKPTAKTTGASSATATATATNFNEGGIHEDGARQDEDEDNDSSPSAPLTTSAITTNPNHEPSDGFLRATFVQESSPSSSELLQPARRRAQKAIVAENSKHNNDDLRHPLNGHKLAASSTTTMTTTTTTTTTTAGTVAEDDDERERPIASAIIGYLADDADDEAEEDFETPTEMMTDDDAPRADLSSIFEANVRREIERFESNTMLRRQQSQSGGGGGGGKLSASQKGGITELRIAEEIRLFNEREKELKQRSGGPARAAASNSSQQAANSTQQLDSIVRFGKTLQIPKAATNHLDRSAQDKHPRASRSIKLTTQAHSGAQNNQPASTTTISMHKFISSGGKRFVYQTTQVSASQDCHQQRPMGSNSSYQLGNHLTKSMSNLSHMSGCGGGGGGGGGGVSLVPNRTVDYRAVDSLKCKEVPNVAPGLTKKTIETFARLHSETSLNRLDQLATGNCGGNNYTSNLNNNSHTLRTSMSSLSNSGTSKSVAQHASIGVSMNGGNAGIPSAEWKIQEELREMRAREAELKSMRDQQHRKQQQSAGPKQQRQPASTTTTNSNHNDNNNCSGGARSIPPGENAGVIGKQRELGGCGGPNQFQPNGKDHQAQGDSDYEESRPNDDYDQYGPGDDNHEQNDDDDDDGDGHDHDNNNSNNKDDPYERTITVNQHVQQGLSGQHNSGDILMELNGSARAGSGSSNSLYPIKQTIDSFRKLNQRSSNEHNDGSSNNNNHSHNQVPMTQTRRTPDHRARLNLKQMPESQLPQGFQRKQFVKSLTTTAATSTPRRPI